MAKFGYLCKCGWKLNRGNKTRKQYAEAKKLHAKGHDDVPGCQFLADELERSKVVMVKRTRTE